MFRPNSTRSSHIHRQQSELQSRLGRNHARSGRQWDVDNDGDGMPDSVWVDLGMPVRYTGDGRAYKPLFAILCLDMDGRLNLNAHGSFAQTQSRLLSAMQRHELAAVPAVEQPVRVVGESRRGIGTHAGTLSQPVAYFAGPVGSPLATPPIPCRGDRARERRRSISCPCSAIRAGVRRVLPGTPIRPCSRAAGHHGPLRTDDPNAAIGSAVPGKTDGSRLPLDAQ